MSDELVPPVNAITEQWQLDPKRRRTMRVVIKVQRKDGVYVIREFDMADDMFSEGVMMTNECMVIGSAFRSMYRQVQLMPEKREGDEL